MESAEQIVDLQHYRLSKDQSKFDESPLKNSSRSDSGYTSTLSDLSSNYGSYRSSLEPITEDVEFQSFSESSVLTPNSRNVQRIDAFHITTPNALTPDKSGQRNRNRYLECTPKKLQSLKKNIFSTPTKSGASLIRRKSSFRSALSRDSSFDYPDENNENASFIDKVPLSPFNCSKSNVSLENQRQFEKKLSENSLQSSTPISAQFESKIQSFTISKLKFQSPKCGILRKTQSFSPSKYFKKQLAAQKTEDSIVLDLPNPARQLLDFSSDKFEKLIHERCASKTPLKKTDRTANISQTEVKNSLIGNDTVLNWSCNLSSLNDTSVQLGTESNSDLNAAHKEIQLKTNPIKRKLSKIDEESQKLFSLPLVPKSLEVTPKKKLRRSVSLNFYDAYKEQCSILYQHLPCTPPKQRKKHLKRTSTAKIECKSPVKRKLYETSTTAITPRNKYYDGVKRLDILNHLSETIPAIELILSYLSDKDLIAAYKVSKNWMRIIVRNGRANIRRTKSLQDQYSSKENVSGLVEEPKIVTNRNRKPFNHCNSMSYDSPKLSKESPSKKRFTDNQKILENLDKSTTLRKCPRCGNSSIIYSNNSTTKTDSTLLSLIEKRKCLKSTRSVDTMFPLQRRTSFTFDLDCDMFNVGKHSTQPPRLSVGQSNSQPLPKSNFNCNDNSKTIDNGTYAICTGSCNFKFCVKCLCAYDSSHVCLITATGSKSLLIKNRMDDNCNNGGTVAGSKRSKRNLRRLCSLDKL